ncbi:MAG TPA: phage tail tape measure protein [Paludibacter sp.]|nr:phage tail tape measure protein [Paludibacter sp.]
MSLKVDKVQLEIIMKADATRAEMRKLDDEAKSIQKSMKGLKKDSEEWNKANQKLADVKAKWNELNNSIALTNKTMKELQDRAKVLNMQLRNMDPNTDKYKEMDAELTKIKTRMSELRGPAANTESSFSKMANGFNKYFAMGAAAVASITGMSLAFRKLAEDIAHMDDVYSDVMKTTNMSKEEVLALNESFKKMDTRTSRESLNNLARDAGKLGIEGSKKILDFVDAGNQINVALGEDLGEDAIKNIGKMVGVFQSSTKELKGLGLKEQMLAVGSAINSLGASSSADESYLVAFAGRLGGVAKQAGISMDAILGFGSALDQDMQQVELSATALQNFIMKLMGDPAKFARLAGLEVKGFTELLKTDANSAIKQVLSALNEKGGFQQLIPIFQEMGLDGARATGVLSAMAGSIDKIDEAQRVANQSMAEGTSITKEYNLKNENLAAKLDKAKKAFNETALELGARLNPLLLKSTNATTYLIKGLVELPKWLNENKLLVTGIVLAIGYYTVATYASIVADKLKVFWTDKVVLSMKSLFAAVKANPWGLIATGVILAISWLNNYLNKQQDVNKEQQKFNDLAEKSKELFNDNKSLEDRAKAMKSLSKSQLETLQTDLDTQIGVLQEFDAKVKTNAQKALSEDKELSKLKKQWSDAKTDIERNSLLAQIKWREDALLEQLAKEYVNNQKSLVNLKKYLNDVNSLLKTKKTTNVSEKSYDDALKLKEEAYKESQLELLEQRRKGELTEETYNQIALQTQLTFLEEKKDLQKRYGKSTVDTEIEISNQKAKITKTADEVILNNLKEAHKSELAAQDAFEKTKLNQIKEDYLNGIIPTREEYEKAVEDLELESLNKRLKAQKDYLALLKAITNPSKEQKQEIEATETAILTTQNSINDKRLKQEDDFQKKKQKVVEKYSKDTILGEYQAQKAALDKLHAEGKMSEKEYQGELLKIKLQAAQKYARQVQELTQAGSDFVESLKDAELMKSQAATQQELSDLTNLYNNKQISQQEYNDRKTQLEYEQASKELETQKKFADTEFAMKVANIGAVTAMGIMNAWASSMTLGPIAGPIAAGILTTLLVGTAAAQISAANSERDKIKAMTLESPASSGGGNTSTGARVVTQAADGRYDVVGAQDGKRYNGVRYLGRARTGLVTTPTLMGEAGTELVIDAPTLSRLNMQAPRFIPWVLSNRVSQRAEGKYDSVQGTNAAMQDSSQLISANIAVMNKTNMLLEDLIKNGVIAPIVLSDFEAKQKLQNRSKAKGSL